MLARPLALAQVSAAVVLVACGPAVRPAPAPARATAAPASRPAPPASAPAPVPDASPAVTLENACDSLCAMVGQACNAERGNRLLAEVTRCVEACVADRLPDADRRCYRARARAANHHARHMFCGHRMSWPRLRPGGCVPSSADGWVATRALQGTCQPGFVGLKGYGGADHLAYCDAAGRLHAALQPALAAPSSGAPALQRVARAGDRLVIFRARRANCGAQLTLGIIDLTAHRATTRGLQLNLGTKRWTPPRLELRAGRAFLTVRDRRGRIRDQLSLPLTPAADPASSGRCAKLRAGARSGGRADPAHPCFGATGDPDHCP